MTGLVLEHFTQTDPMPMGPGSAFESPYVYGMSGAIYLACAVVLGMGFVAYAWQLWRSYSDALARRTFRFSIWHLSLLFLALLVDHYLAPWLSHVTR